MGVIEFFDPQDWEYHVIFYTDDGVSICVYYMVGFDDFPDDHNIKMLVKEFTEDKSHDMSTLVHLCNIKVVDKQIGIDIMDENFLNWNQ